LPDNSFIDARDGSVYETLEVGNQVWMAQNLRSKTEQAVYGFYVPAFKYGCLYVWEELMDGADSSTEIPSGVQD
jgi:uncharacterized protein (TIGR02145 family)